MHFKNSRTTKNSSNTTNINHASVKTSENTKSNQTEAPKPNQSLKIIPHITREENIKIQADIA